MNQKKRRLLKNEYLYPEKMMYKRNKIKSTVYQPLNEIKPMDSSFIKLDNLLKKENLDIISNNEIKKIILNFSKEKKPKFMRNKSNLSTSSSIDILKLPNINRTKNFSGINIFATKKESEQIIIKIKEKLQKKEKFETLHSSNKYLLNEYEKNSRNKMKFRSVSQDNIFEDNHKIDNSILKKIKIKKFRNIINIKDCFLRNSVGQLDPLKITKNKFKKINQNSCFSKLNFFSKSLGLISLIGIFNGHGKNGNLISRYAKNFFLDYFENNENMTLSLTKDNYYSILNESFIRCQEFLINNSKNLNYNLNISGCTCCIILYPYDNKSKNKIFCANCGDCKCLLYSYNTYVPLSYPHSPDINTEKIRMNDRLLDLKKKKLEDQLQYSIEDNKIKTNNKKDNNINIRNEKNLINNSLSNSNSNENNKIINSLNSKKNLEKMPLIDKISKISLEKTERSLKYGASKKKEEENNDEKEEFSKRIYLKEFEELNLSRSIGDLYADELGIIREPEIVECDLKFNQGRFLVMGTNSLFMFLSNEEIGNIVKKYNNDDNGFKACKELEELARERWKKNLRRIDDITIIVIYLDWKK